MKVILGAVLTFAAPDGASVQLTVSTVDTASAALAWGDRTLESPTPGPLHRFGPLPLPSTGTVAYTLSAGTERLSRTVKAIPQEGLRIALYGDSRDGHGPHRTLSEAIRAADPHVVIHTGDVVHRAGAGEWAAYLAAALPVSAEVPVILALGNHELYPARGGAPRTRADALEQALSQVPPPEDPVARAAGAPPAAFHVRVGPVLVVSLDSNRPMGAGGPQLTFLERAVRTSSSALSLVALHHGPASSGKHGPHPDAGYLIAALQRLGVTASLAGHDHTYERIARGGVTYLVSGGGGAPLYKRRHLERGSRAFASTYNWSMLTLRDGGFDLVSRSLEGAVLDAARVAPGAGADVAPAPWAMWGAAAALWLVGLGYAVFRLVRGRVARRGSTR